MTPRWITIAMGMGALLAQSALAAECVAPVPCDGPFVAYELKVQGLTSPAGLMDVPVLGLDDIQVSATGLTLRRLYTPAEPQDVDGTHLVAYEGVPLPPVDQVVTVDTAELGVLTGRLRLPGYVMVDAEKRIGGPAPAPAFTRVWACYGFRVGGLRTRATWTDQFGDGAATIDRTSYACFPATLGAATVASAPLVCGRTRDWDRPVGYVEGVNIHTAWGFAGPVMLEGPDEFCVAGALVP